MDKNHYPVIASPATTPSSLRDATPSPAKGIFCEFASATGIPFAGEGVASRSDDGVVVIPGTTGIPSAGEVRGAPPVASRSDDGVVVIPDATEITFQNIL